MLGSDKEEFQGEKDNFLAHNGEYLCKVSTGVKKSN